MFLHEAFQHPRPRLPFEVKKRGQVHRSAPPDKAAHVITVQSDICAQQLRGSSIWNGNSFLFAKQSETLQNPPTSRWSHFSSRRRKGRDSLWCFNDVLKTIMGVEKKREANHLSLGSAFVSQLFQDHERQGTWSPGQFCRKIWLFNGSARFPHFSWPWDRFIYLIGVIWCQEITGSLKDTLKCGHRLSSLKPVESRVVCRSPQNISGFSEKKKKTGNFVF